MQDHEQEPKRKFTGVWIPAHVWERDDLGWIEKCLIAEIHSLGGDTGNCYAGNGHLAEKMGVSERRIGQMLASLKSAGLLKEQSFDGRKRYLATINMGGVTKMSYESGNLFPVRVEENFHADSKEISSRDIQIRYTDENKTEDSQTSRDVTRYATIPECLSNFPGFTVKWDEWLVYRKQIKHPLALKTQSKQLNTLSKFKGHVAIQMIDQAIEKGWQGLYPLKNQQTNQNQPINV
jgi:hypothetical protein